MDYCRMCAKILHQDGVSLMNPEVQHVTEWLENKLELELDSGLPVGICGSCKQMVESWLDFLIKCDKANRLLTLQLQQRQHATGEVAPLVLTEAATLSQCELPETEQSTYQNLVRKYNLKDLTVRIERLTDVLLPHTTTNIKRLINMPVPHTTTNKPTLALHDRNLKSSSVKMFACSQCSSTFTMISNMRQHVKRMHESSWDFECAVCNKTFRTKGEMVCHSISHQTSRPFACNQCSFKFKTKMFLKNHKSTAHSTLRPFKCLQCLKAFKYKVFQSDMDKTRRLTNCLRDVWCIGNLTEHMAGVHSNARLIQCSLCDRSYKTTASRSMHMRIMHVKTQHDCKHCDASFNSISNLRRHVNTIHKKIKPYLCYDCNRNFSSKSELRSHTLVHIKFRYFKCDECGKMFKNERAVKRHKKTHSDARPFTCDICSCSFKSRGEIIAHFKYHYNMREYKCKFCSKGFNSSSNLSGHVQIVHLKKKT